MKTLLLPLDERPCNYNYPKMIGQSNKEIKLIMPEHSILGDKKTPTDVNKLEEFLLANANDATNAVISIDMLVYGGLIPSRIHHQEQSELFKRLEVLKKLKEINPKMRIYAFCCIMRTPQYDSSDEEPDYYADYGFALFRRKYLLDYEERHGLNGAEGAELAGINIPQDIIDDYDTRRDKNMLVNLEVVKYLEGGTIDFLIIPQDDSSPYGYTAIAQKQVIKAVEEKGLFLNCMIYPGADEVALTLLTRAYHDFKNIEPKVYPFYASVLGPTIIPKYEDRPMYESLKSHIRACKARIVATPKEADVILAVNSPGKFMEETYDETLDITHSSYRNVLDFTLNIKNYIEEGFNVAVCDAALCNGGDKEMVRYLDELGVLDKIISYAGWNTHCNTLGTTLAEAFTGGRENKHNLLYRLIEDICYQAMLRNDVTEQVEDELGVQYFDISSKQKEVEEIVRKRLEETYSTLKISKNYPVKINELTLPWKRMFEIGMKLELK